MWLSLSVSTEAAETSDPVPAVVGTQMSGKIGPGTLSSPAARRPKRNCWAVWKDQTVRMAGDSAGESGGDRSAEFMIFPGTKVTHNNGVGGRRTGRSIGQPLRRRGEVICCAVIRHEVSA